MTQEPPHGPYAEGGPADRAYQAAVERGDLSGNLGWDIGTLRGIAQSLGPPPDAEAWLDRQNAWRAERGREPRAYLPAGHELMANCEQLIAAAQQQLARDLDSEPGPDADPEPDVM